MQKPRSMVASKRAGRHAGVVIELRSSSEPIPSLPPGKWLAPSRALWTAFWSSPIAQTVDRLSDMPRLSRWLTYCDEWFRLVREYRSRRVVEGSKGQPVMNPAFDAALKLEREIARVEERFGLTPLDRMRLGISYGEARRSLADINDELDGEDGDVYELPGELVEAK